MKKFIAKLLPLIVLMLLVFPFISLAQTADGVITVSVTNAAANITVDRDCSYVMIRENSATPAALYSVKLAGTTTAINLAAGMSFTFVANKESNTSPGVFKSGTVIGTITATTAGPFSFIGIETYGNPHQIAKSSSGGTGGGVIGMRLVRSATGWNPAASTTYFYDITGNMLSTPNCGSFTNMMSFTVPVSGTVSAFYISTYMSSVATGAVNPTFTLYKNCSATPLTMTQDWTTAANPAVASDTTHTVTVAAGDQLQIKVVTPAWSGNPVSVRSIFDLKITGVS